MKTKITFLLLLLALVSGSLAGGELQTKSISVTTRMAAVMIR